MNLKPKDKKDNNIKYIPKRTIAAKFLSYKKLANTLLKKRGKKLPTVPIIFNDLEIWGDFAINAYKKPFLRYENIMAINLGDQCLIIMTESDE